MGKEKNIYRDRLGGPSSVKKGEQKNDPRVQHIGSPRKTPTIYMKKHTLR
jgi:hypothetical protein